LPWRPETELAAFAASVEIDEDVVSAAILVPSSSGQAEGKVNRIQTAQS
jgi:transposase